MMYRGSSSSSSSSAVPMIPGMLSTHHRETSRPDFRKRQILEQMSVGKALDVDAAALGMFASKLNDVRQGQPTAVPPPPPSVPFARPSAAAAAVSKLNSNGNGSTKYRVDATQPTWITHDRQVLRFFGYFQENAIEAGRETHRTRRITLCYYLSDCALSISEPRVPNSGMAQGEFMRRTVATKPDGSRFTPHDLRVGGSVKLYGRVFQLVDCDDATRTYYREALGTELEAAHRYPDDESSHVDEIEAIKRKLRAKTASIAASRAEATRKFHDNAHKVLRFYVSWRDAHPLYPETRRYVLHYYLSDDTIEVVEPKEPPLHPQHHQERQRVGNHHFAVLISRRRVAKDSLRQTISSGLFGDPGAGKQLLTDRDLRCGDSVTILARTFLLEDCDSFTRDYYLETHGVTQERCELEPAAMSAKASKWRLFQAQALDDVRSSELGQRAFSPAMLHRLDAHVQDNQSRKSPHTLGGPEPPPLASADNSLDRKQLRFRAKFHGLARNDLNAQREFTLTYFLEDDTLMVFEPRVKNSGITGGRFLDRGRFRKCHDAASGDTNSREHQKDRSAYCASDFFVGAVVQFEFSPHQRLELLAADEQTLSYCESHCERFPFSNVQLVLEAVAHALLRTKSVDFVRRACRSVDRAGTHTLSDADFKRVLDMCGALAALNAHQILTLCRKFAASARDSEDNSSGGVSPPLLDNLHVAPLTVLYDECCDALTCCVVKRLDATAKAPLRTDQDAGLGKLFKVPNLRALLRCAASSSDASTVSSDAFLRIASFYRVALSASDVELLMSKFSRNGAVEYHRLCDSVFAMPSLAADASSASTSALQSHNQTDSPRDDEFAFASDDGDLVQHCERPATSRSSLDSHTPRRSGVSKLAFQPASAPRRQPSPTTQQQSYASAAQPTGNGTSRSSGASDARVVAILRRVFGARKYQLRKALRERDTLKTGQLDEEAFMDAVLALEPALSDDDTYAIADAYFPTNNCELDYAQLLESAFRT